MKNSYIRLASVGPSRLPIWGPKSDGQWLRTKAKDHPNMVSYYSVNKDKLDPKRWEKIRSGCISNCTTLYSFISSQHNDLIFWCSIVPKFINLINENKQSIACLDFVPYISISVYSVAQRWVHKYVLGKSVKYLISFLGLITRVS